MCGLGARCVCGYLSGCVLCVACVRARVARAYSLCVVGKGKVVDMSNLAAISDMHGHSPLVCVRVFFSRHPLFFFSVSIPYAKRMPFPPLVYRDDISSSITSWHIAISCS